MGHHQHDYHDDHGGLLRDLRQTQHVLERRRLVKFALAASAFQLLGCHEGTGTDSTIAGNPNAATCSKIPEETAGPYPGDGSNGPSVLNQAGVVRSDIRSSFAGLTGTAGGVPLTVVLSVVSASACTPLVGRAVYLWHCDREGRYSLYTTGVTNQNYCRGVQATDSEGKVTFTTVFPGCYAGRWPHMHFEVYPSLTAATSANNKVATSQLAFPKNACDVVYATAGYESSVTNLRGVSLATDGIFADSAALETATMSGSVSAGYVANLTVAV